MNILAVSTLLLGCLMIISGVAHDIAVLRSDHGREYNRDLLRLLMDGHILITCGLMQVLAWKGLQQNQTWAHYLAGLACISLLVYCAMIFPFQRSIGTILINTVLLIFLAISWFRPMTG